MAMAVEAARGQELLQPALIGRFEVPTVFHPAAVTTRVAAWAGASLPQLMAEAQALGLHFALLRLALGLGSRLAAAARRADRWGKKPQSCRESSQPLRHSFTRHALSWRRGGRWVHPSRKGKEVRRDEERL